MFSFVLECLQLGCLIVILLLLLVSALCLLIR